MKHKQKFKVALIGSKSKGYIDEKTGVKISYFRNSFVIDGEYHDVKDDSDLAGRGAIVMFIKKGELAPSGEKVVQDCFTLVTAWKAGTAAAANAAAAEVE